MVSFTAITIAIVALLSSVSAAPSSMLKRDMSAKRDITWGRGCNLQYCKDFNFGQPCFDSIVPTNLCIPVSNDVGNDAMSAIALRGINCQFYRDYECQGPSFRMAAGESVYALGGAQDLSGHNFNWNDQVSSYFCTPTSA